MISSLPCVIFAGGKSSRMGEDKALLPFGTHATLTEYQLHKLSQIFSHLFISCKSSDKFDFDANFIEDTITKNYAPTAAFLAIFEQLQCERFFAISVDAPFIDKTIIQKLMEEDKKEFDATIAKSPNGIEPLCGIYHKSLYPHFQKMQKNNEHRLTQLLLQSNTHFVNFDEKRAFLNLNRPGDYKEALQLLKN